MSVTTLCMIAGSCGGARGYALPAAIVAKLANPHTPAVAFDGDGSFAMTMSELETAVRLNLESLVVLVSYNNSFGTIRRHQNREFPGRAVGTSLCNIDFSVIAKAMGAEGYKVKRNDDFAKTMRAVLNAGCPAVIEIAVSDNSPGPWDDNK